MFSSYNVYHVNHLSSVCKHDEFYELEHNVQLKEC